MSRSASHVSCSTVALPVDSSYTQHGRSERRSQHRRTAPSLAPEKRSGRPPSGANARAVASPRSWFAWFLDDTDAQRDNHTREAGSGKLPSQLTERTRIQSRDPAVGLVVEVDAHVLGLGASLVDVVHLAHIPRIVGRAEPEGKRATGKELEDRKNGIFKRSKRPVMMTTLTDSCMTQVTTGAATKMQAAKCEGLG